MQLERTLPDVQLIEYQMFREIPLSSDIHRGGSAFFNWQTLPFSNPTQLPTVGSRAITIRLLILIALSARLVHVPGTLPVASLKGLRGIVCRLLRASIPMRLLISGGQATKTLLT